MRVQTRDVIEQKRKDQEIAPYLEKLDEEASEALIDLNKRGKRQMQTVLRDQLNSLNDEILDRKELATEQEKLEEQRVIRYIKEKAVSLRF